jgi:putative transposase
MRKPYMSDLTDDQWSLLEPLIPVHTVGRPRTNAGFRQFQLYSRT